MINTNSAVNKGLEFEQKVTDALNRWGFQAHRTNKANSDDLDNYKKGFDGGVDIIARYIVSAPIPKIFTFYIQCKNHEAPLEKSAISEVLVGMQQRTNNNNDNNCYPVVIYQNKASKETIQFAKDNGVELLTLSEMRNIQPAKNGKETLYNSYGPLAKIIMYHFSRASIWIDTMPDNNSTLENISSTTKLLEKAKSDFNNAQAYIEHATEIEKQALQKLSSIKANKEILLEAKSILDRARSERQKAVDIIKVLVYRYLKSAETILNYHKEKVVEEETKVNREVKNIEEQLLRFLADSLDYSDFLQGLNKLDSIQRQILFEQLQSSVNNENKVKIEYKHTKKETITLEVRQTESFEKTEINCCLHCGSIAIKKHGTTSKGVQRYICKDCGKTFTENYGLITHYSHLQEWQWLEIVRGIACKMSLTEIAKNTNISASTVWAYKLKICTIIQGVYGSGDTGFNGIVEADGKYERVSFKGKKDSKFFIEKLGRLPRHHRSKEERKEYINKADLFEELFTKKPALLKEMLYSSQKRMVGRATIDISHQHVCIMTAIDINNRIYIKPLTTGNATSNDVYNSLNTAISSEAVLVTDDHHSYKMLCKKNDLEHKIITDKSKNSKAFNLGRVNSLHSAMDSYFSSANMPATKYLDLHLALFWFYQKNKDIAPNEFTKKIYELVTGSMSNEARANSNRITIKDLTNRPYPIDTKGFF